MRLIKLRNTLSSSAALALLSVLSLNGCSRFLIDNELPEAKVQLLLNGAPVDTEQPIAFMGTPFVFTLDGSMSSDDDGTIAKYLWLNTDVPASVRYDAGIMNLASYTGDPMPVASPQVTLGEGHYQFSLWVTDNEGTISAPATLEFTIETPTTYMPDAACVAGYMSDTPSCNDCVCTPAAMMGCLETYNACFANPDPMFVMLCTAVVACAQSVGCAGTACYTGGCMAQIDAAATYMGGTLTDCSMGDAALNPCAAASQLGVCSSTGVCMAACN